MRALLPPLALLAACALPVTGTNSRPNIVAAPSVDSLRGRITTILAGRAGADVAVYYHELSRPDSLTFNADVSYHAASTMKVPVMIELFRRVDSRTLSLDQTVVLENSFPSLADGAPYALDRNGGLGRFPLHANRPLRRAQRAEPAHDRALEQLRGQRAAEAAPR